MTETTQRHPLKNKNFLTISVNGRHQYWTDDDPVKRPSVTGLTGFTDSDGFGAGKGYAIKQAELTGNPRAAIERDALAKSEGQYFHACVDNFIRHGVISEDPPFLCWWKAVGVNREWMASETLVYHDALKFGGTLDAISLEPADVNGERKMVLWDWKTVDPDSWRKYGSSLRWIKDHAQVSGYRKCLRDMGSVYEIDTAYICYVMRDGSHTVTEKVDLAYGEKIFDASATMYMLQKEAKQ